MQTIERASIGLRYERPLPHQHAAPLGCSWRFVALIAALLLATPSANAQESSCRIAAQGLALTGLPEASGVAASRSTPGLLWSHNDSGEPILFALSTEGAVKGKIRVTGAQVGDWESVSVGPCPQGNCVYIGDIGDNNAKRPDITIYRVPEPKADAKATAGAESIRATYPDGSQDAEAMLVLLSGAVFIVTKGEHGPVGLYRVPSQFRNGTSVQLERVATVVPAGGNKKGGVANPLKVTEASASADGRWVALRTHNAITFYAASEFIAGRIRAVFKYDVTPVREPQGEGIALAADGVVWLTSEGGGKKRPGTLARLDCTLR